MSMYYDIFQINTIHRCSISESDFTLVFSAQDSMYDFDVMIRITVDQPFDVNGTRMSFFYLHTLQPAHCDVPRSTLLQLMRHQVIEPIKSDHTRSSFFRKFSNPFQAEQTRATFQR